MSCATLNLQPVNLNVSMGALPEGFCPVSEQERANAIISRLIINPGATTSSFAIGSIEPSSNVGPWLKDCLVWYVWDDNLSRYVEMTFPGVTQEIDDAKPILTARYLGIDYDLTAVNVWQDVLTYTTVKPTSDVHVTAQGAFRGNGDYASARLICGTVESQIYGGPSTIGNWDAAGDSMLVLSLAASNLTAGTVVRLQIAVLGTVVIASPTKGRAYASVTTANSGNPVQNNVTYLNVLES